MEFLFYIYLISMFVIGVLLFLSMIKLINITELEQDSMNPMDMCKETDKLFIPELAVMIVLFLMFLINARWIEIISLAPVVIYQLRLLLLQRHQLNPTEIYYILPSFKKISIAKMVFFLLFFFFILYRFISGLINGFNGTPPVEW